METTPSDPDFFARMTEMVARRYRASAGKSLRDVYQLDAGFLDTGSDAEFAVRHRTEILAVLADPGKFAQLVDLFVDQTIEFTYASNQFIQLDDREQAELRRLYTLYLRRIRSLLASIRTAEELAAGLHGLVLDHFRGLRANIARFFDRAAGEDEQANVILQKVVSAEYAPELQLEVLGITLELLQPPVLDLGCGREGGLVRYLNAQGIPAVGVDRVVEPAPELIQADWLSYPLEPGSWGAVISHLAFSNHFVFHHHYRYGRVEPYARQYMAILRSLKVGGSFYYTPALPFIEQFLPAEKYRVRRWQASGSEVFYSCTVSLIA